MKGPGKKEMKMQSFSKQQNLYVCSMSWCQPSSPVWRLDHR